MSRITSLGKAMAAFPLAPRYGKMLALSHQHNLLPYTVALVAALTVPEVLIETPLDVKESVDGEVTLVKLLRNLLSSRQFGTYQFLLIYYHSFNTSFFFFFFFFVNLFLSIIIS